MPQKPEQREMPVVLRFPMFGIDLSQAYSSQRPQTCVSGINVQAFEAGQSRMRGGTRPGLTPITGIGSTAQVSGFNPIQSLSVVVTASPDATFQNAFTSLNLKLDYSEVNSPPARDAPTVNTPLQWFTGASPTFTGTTGVIVGTPDTPGGRGFGVATFQISDDGTTVSVLATFISAGFDGPYTYSGPPQVQTVSQADVDFYNPSLSNISSSWAVVSGGNICQYIFKISST